MNIDYHRLLLIQTSACIAETSTYPIDYLKTKIQINSQKVSVFDISRKIIQNRKLMMNSELLDRYLLLDSSSVFLIGL